MKKLSKEQILLLHTQLIKETVGRNWSLCLEYQLIYLRNSKSNWFAVFLSGHSKQSGRYSPEICRLPPVEIRKVFSLQVILRERICADERRESIIYQSMAIREKK